MLLALAALLFTLLAQLGSWRQHALSSYEPFLMSPNKTQRREGGHWLTCVLAVRKPGKNPVEGTKLREPASLDGRGVPDRFELCVGRGRLTNCARPHSHRAVHASRISGTWTERRYERVRTSVCPKKTRGDSWYSWYRSVTAKNFILICFGED